MRRSACPAVLGLLLALATTSSALAAVPRTLAFQGQFTSAGGQPMSGITTLQFKLYDEGGSPLWTETHVVPLENGLCQVVLGKTSTLDLGFDEVYFLGVKVGSDPELEPRLALAGAPYAFRARTVEGPVSVTTDQPVAIYGETTSAAALSSAMKAKVTGAEQTAVWAEASGTDSSGLYAIGRGAGGVAVMAEAQGSCASALNADASGVANGTGIQAYGATSGSGQGIYASGATGVTAVGTTWALATSGDINCQGNQIVSGNLTVGGQVLSSLSVQGTLVVGGNLSVTGTKNFVTPHPEDPSREIVYVSLEGGEAGTYCRGQGQLSRGRAVVLLPEHFTLVTAEEGLTVQVTPTRECKGLWVARRSSRSFEVRELGRGRGDATFDWYVHGLRKGFEDHRVVRERTPVQAAAGATKHAPGE